MRSGLSRTPFHLSFRPLGHAPRLQAAVNRHDIVVYGGTSGGLTTSGLGWTDLGSDAILGGLSRDFYIRVYHCYDEAPYEIAIDEPISVQDVAYDNLRKRLHEDGQRFER